jgi:hypothetical protein
MSNPTIQLRRGTTAQCDAVTPDSGEPLWDTTVKQLRIGDGSTAGGNKIPTNTTAPVAHKDSHDPEDGSDALDTAAPAEIASVQSAAVGTAHSLARSDHAHAISHSIADNHIVTIDSADVATGEYAKFTANGLESKTVGELVTDISAQAVSRTFLANTFSCPVPGTDWTPQIDGCHLAASKSAKKFWIPLSFLKLGDIITSYKIVGDAVETTALTLDCKLVQVNLADPLTTTDIANGAIVQVTADGNFDVEANCDDTTVATDKQYALEVLGTTDTGDELTVMGAEVVVTRLI